MLLALKACYGDSFTFTLLSTYIENTVSDINSCRTHFMNCWSNKSVTGFLFSMFSPHAPRREMNSTILSTNLPVPSPLSSPVQETARKAPHASPRTRNETLISCPWNEAQVSGPENQADAFDLENEAESSDYQNNVQGSNRENRVKIPGPITKEKNPPKDIEEIRKAAEAAAEELEKLEQLKITTKMNLQRLKLAEVQAIEELARKQKHTEETVRVCKVGDLLP
jgi:hypothetical protein